MATQHKELEAQLAAARAELAEQRQRLQDLEGQLANVLSERDTQQRRAQALESELGATAAAETRQVEAAKLLAAQMAPEVDRLKQERDRVVQRLAEQELELDRLTEEIYNTYEELNLLYDLGKSTTLDLTELYRTFQGRVQMTLDAEEGALVVAGESSLDVVACWGRVRDQDRWKRFCLLVADDVSRRNNSVSINGLDSIRESHWRTRLSPEVYDELHDLHQAGEIRNMLTVPLRAEKEAMGAVVLLNRGGSSDIFLARDEKLLMALARQTSIAIETVHMSQQIVRQRRMERELEIASNIQASLLPPRPPKVPGVEVAGRCWPASEVGGDYFDYIPLGNGLGVSCGDVMGKGVPAALVMAMTHSALRSAARDNPMPGRLLETVNNIMYEDCDRIETNLTLCYTYFEPGAGCVYYSNAGHLPPMIWRAGAGAVEYLKGEGSTGTMIGVLQETSYGDTRAPLSLGDIVLMYSDGVTEAVDHDGEYFGEELLEQLLQEHHAGSMEALVEAIHDRVMKFAQGLPQADDITVVAVKAVAP